MKNLEELIEKTGIVGVQFESYLYKVAEHFSKDYNGGYWKSYTHEDLPGFYMLFDKKNMYEIRNDQNGYDKGSMDAKTFSLSIWAFALNMFALQLWEKGHDKLADDFFMLFRTARDVSLLILNEEQHSQLFWFLD